MNIFLIWYALLTGAVLSVNHIGMKLMKGNLHTSLFYGFLLCAIINLILAYTQQEKLFSPDIKTNFLGILLFALGNGMMIYLVVRGYRSGLSVVTYPLMYNVISIMILMGVNYYFFKGQLNAYNMAGLVVGAGAMYLLNVK